MRMAGIGPSLRSSLRFPSTWRSFFATSARGNTAAYNATPITTKFPADICETPSYISIKSGLPASALFISPCATAVVPIPSGLPVAAATSQKHTLFPRSFPPFSMRIALRVSSFPHLSPCLPRSLSSSSTPPWFSLGHATPVVKEQNQRSHPEQQQRVHCSQQVEAQEFHVRSRSFHNHTRHHYENPQERHQQRQEGHHHQGGASSRALAMLAVSPLLFTEWDKTSDPKNELLFLAGNTLGYCTEKFFENEYGQSIFACVLGLVYLALLGYEGKINGAVWRMKHLFGTNMKIVGHPRYAYALPKNPLLSSYQKCASK